MSGDESILFVELLLLLVVVKYIIIHINNEP